MKIIHVVGARPNFMKVAPLMEAFDAYRSSGECPVDIRQILVHTGQHYDRTMSDLFFEQLGMPKPDINMGIGSGTHGRQTGRIMEEFEQILLDHQPDLLLVVGDVNSTMACTIDAKKLGIPVAHVEAGLRSGDITMPEEINRIVTDAISDLLFTTDRVASENMRCAGVPQQRIHFVGNVMIDTLMKHRERALAQPTLTELGLMSDERPLPYGVVTLHRPGNVEHPVVLKELGEAFAAIGKTVPLVFPVHPRTRGRIQEFGLGELFSEKNGVRVVEALGYLDFLNLMANAQVVLTDSGGVQEETTILGVPCLTLRPNTERPVTVEQGTNRIVGTGKEAILSAFETIEQLRQPGRIPELWDGRAAERIVRVIVDWYQEAKKSAGAAVAAGG